MDILVTGCSGFIGFHLCNKLLSNKKNKLIGIDDLNSYYDAEEDISSVHHHHVGFKNHASSSPPCLRGPLDHHGLLEQHSSRR